MARGIAILHNHLNKFHQINFPSLDKCAGFMRGGGKSITNAGQTSNMQVNWHVYQQ
jgi:hypothetical protein